MATYLETQTRIANELSRDDLTAEIKLAILSAIDYYKKRRWPWNETASTLTTTASVAYVALPSNYIELDKLQITIGSNNVKMRQQPMYDIIEWRTNSTTGQPTDYAIYQNRVELYPTPNDAYNLPIYYLYELTVLSADADTNTWLTDAEELIRLHAKKDLYVNKIKNTKAAQDMQAMEDSVLLRMESWNQRRTGTGKTKAYYL